VKNTQLEELMLLLVPIVVVSVEETELEKSVDPEIDTDPVAVREVSEDEPATFSAVPT
jgi:myo-inositol-hexaphosphate 3-phosphohydrolase